MLDGVVPVTYPLLKSSFIDDKKPIRQKVYFLDVNGPLANPVRAPILRTKSVTTKQMDKCVAEI